MNIKLVNVAYVLKIRIGFIIVTHVLILYAEIVINKLINVHIVENRDPLSPKRQFLIYKTGTTFKSSITSDFMYK